MTITQLLQRIAENHNRVASMMVSGDNAVLAGDTIKDMRLLVEQIGREGVFPVDESEEHFEDKG